jgi:hypothetical protein
MIESKKNWGAVYSASVFVEMVDVIKANLLLLYGKKVLLLIHPPAQILAAFWALETRRIVDTEAEDEVGLACPAGW